MTDKWHDMRISVVALVCVLLTSCTLKAGVQAPEVTTPDGWAYADSTDTDLPANWWTAFASDELNTLVQQALQNSPDVLAAAARLRQAEAQVTVASASLWPTVGLSADATRSGAWGESGARGYQAGVAASYELDVWGGLRAGRRAALAARDASQHDQDAVRTTVVAAVVTSWLEVVALQQRLALALDSLSNAEQVLQRIETRYQLGAAGLLEVTQQRAQIASQRGSIPALQQQLREQQAALAVLLGQTAQQLSVETAALDTLGLPQAPSSLPAQVLLRRPDVQRVEAQLLASEADVVAARAALFPSLSVSGATNWSSASSGDLFSGDPLWRLAGSVSQALFQGGRLRARTEAARARYDELAAGYVQTVVSALAEAEVALTAVQALDEQQRWQQAQREQAAKAYELSMTRYQAGSVDFLSVLDAQRSLLASDDSLVQLRRARLQAQVTLYRTLGAVPLMQ